MSSQIEMIQSHNKLQDPLINSRVSMQCLQVLAEVVVLNLLSELSTTLRSHTHMYSGIRWIRRIRTVLDFIARNVSICPIKYLQVRPKPKSLMRSAPETFLLCTLGARNSRHPTKLRARSYSRIDTRLLFVPKPRIMHSNRFERDVLQLPRRSLMWMPGTSGWLYGCAASQLSAVNSFVFVVVPRVIGQHRRADIKSASRIYRANCSSDRLATNVSFSHVDNVTNGLLRSVYRVSRSKSRL